MLFLTHSIHLMSIINNIFILVFFFCLFLLIVYSRYILTFTFEFIWCREISHVYLHVHVYNLDWCSLLHKVNAAAWLFVLGFFGQAWWCIQKFADNQKLWLLIINIHVIICRCFSVCMMKKANGIPHTYTYVWYEFEVWLKCEFQKVWKTDTNWRGGIIKQKKNPVCMRPKVAGRIPHQIF